MRRLCVFSAWLPLCAGLRPSALHMSTSAHARIVVATQNSPNGDPALAALAEVDASFSSRVVCSASSEHTRLVLSPIGSLTAEHDDVRRVADAAERGAAAALAMGATELSLEVILIIIRHVACLLRSRLRLATSNSHHGTLLLQESQNIGAFKKATIRPPPGRRGRRGDGPPGRRRGRVRARIARRAARRAPACVRPAAGARGARAACGGAQGASRSAARDALRGRRDRGGPPARARRRPVTCAVFHMPA